MKIIQTKRLLPPISLAYGAKLGEVILLSLASFFQRKIEAKRFRYADLGYQ